MEGDKKWRYKLYEGKRFASLNEVTYLHKDTGQNLSVDEEKMLQSTCEFLDIMIRDDKYKKQAIKIKRAVLYKYKFKFGNCSEKIKQSILHPIVFAKNVIYYIGYKGI